MVTSGQINNDSEALTNLLKKYESVISNMGNNWKGKSYDNLNSRAYEFSSEYLSCITSQMNSFSHATSLYEEYKQRKQNYEILTNNYRTAVANNDANAINEFSRQASSENSIMNKLKEKINYFLDSASNTKLNASINNNIGSSKSGVLSSNSSNSSNGLPSEVNAALDWAKQIADDDNHGYSQATRNGNPNYDCSSFVINAYDQAGVPVKDAGATYTGNMRNAFKSVGFEEVKYNSIDDLKPGDVLLDEAYHTEMYYGNGKVIGARGGDKDGLNGDSTGEEICVTDLSNLMGCNFDVVLRYTGK